MRRKIENQCNFLKEENKEEAYLLDQYLTELTLNDIAKCTISLDREIAVDPYHENRYTGSFIIIDKYNNSTVGAGMIVSSVEGFAKLQDDDKKVYSKAEIELNEFIRRNYPEWNCKEI